MLHSLKQETLRELSSTLQSQGAEHMGYFAARRSACRRKATGSFRP